MRGLSDNPKLLLIIIVLIFAVSCSNDEASNEKNEIGDDAGDDASSDDDISDDDIDDDLSNDDTVDDDALDDDSNADDDSTDDDTSNDDSGDDDASDDDTFAPWHNPTAKADAFRLFYKELMSREILSYNRFSLSNDVVPAITFGNMTYTKVGNQYEITAGPVDNNDIGFATFNNYQAYRVFRTRELGLSLIRMFEGLVIAEGISGHPGITCREWMPAWNLEIDGVNGNINRTQFGVPVEPAESFPPALEQEVIDTFFNGMHFLYRANPTEFYFTIQPIVRTGAYAVTFVFQEMPDYLRVSDCCSSYMVSKLGTYQGYFWGNHNSRDNFPDYTLGYLAALECMNDPEADADIVAAAQRAYAAGKRIGDSVVQYGYRLMTVSEFFPYDHLIVAGAMGPDGQTAWEDLGSLDSCQMSYMAKALSSEGLHSPNEEVEAPGSYEIIAIKMLFELLGLEPPDITKTCHNLDDGYGPFSWKDFLELKIFGISLFDIINSLIDIIPDQIIPIVEGLVDVLYQPEMSAAAVVYYAKVTEQDELLQAAKETLFHILEIHRKCAVMLMDFASDNSRSAQMIIHHKDGSMYDSRSAILWDAQRAYYLAVRLAHIYGVGNGDYDPGDFEPGIQEAELMESMLFQPDTPMRPMMSDEEIWGNIQNELSGAEDIIVQRYYTHFPEDPPIHNAGDHYQAVGLDGEFQDIPNISNQWWGGFYLWWDIPMCSFDGTVLDCSWAILGCERPDLDASGVVDAADQVLFDAAWASYGVGASCSSSNNWCDGADLDRSGILDAQDSEFMGAAQGCWY